MRTYLRVTPFNGGFAPFSFRDHTLSMLEWGGGAGRRIFVWVMKYFRRILIFILI